MASVERVLGHRFVMGAVAREAALEEDEALDLKRLRRKAGAPLDIIPDLPRPAALPSGKRKVRMKGTTLGFQAHLLTDTLDLGGKCDDGRLWLDACPQSPAG